MPRPARRRLRLERLEDRTVPTALPAGTVVEVWETQTSDNAYPISHLTSGHIGVNRIDPNTGASTPLYVFPETNGFADGYFTQRTGDGVGSGLHATSVTDGDAVFVALEDDAQPAAFAKLYKIDAAAGTVAQVGTLPTPARGPDDSLTNRGFEFVAGKLLWIAGTDAQTVMGTVDRATGAYRPIALPAAGEVLGGLVPPKDGVGEIAISDGGSTSIASLDVVHGTATALAVVAHDAVPSAVPDGTGQIFSWQHLIPTGEASFDTVVGVSRLDAAGGETVLRATTFHSEANLFVEQDEAGRDYVLTTSPSGTTVEWLDAAGFHPVGTVPHPILLSYQGGRFVGTWDESTSAGYSAVDPATARETVLYRVPTTTTTSPIDGTTTTRPDYTTTPPLSTYDGRFVSEVSGATADGRVMSYAVRLNPASGTGYELGRYGHDELDFTVAPGDPTPPPLTPVADAGGPYQVDEGGTVALAGSGSEAGGSIAAYEWDLNYDGATFTADAAGAGPTFDAALLDGPAVRTVALRVRDANGVYSTPSVTTVAVANVSPAAAFAAAGPAVANSALAFTFGAVSDPSAADVAAGFRYSVALTPDALAATYAAAGAAPSPTLTFAEPGVFTVYGRVFDKDGGAADYQTAVVVSATQPVDPPAGLVAWWKGDGDARDSAGPNGGSTDGGFVAGEVGRAFAFNADAGQGFRAFTAGLPTGDADRTVEFWAKIDQYEPETFLAGYGAFLSAGGSYEVGVTGGRLFFTDGSSQLVNRNARLTTGAWHHVAVTNAGGHVTLYLDGIDVAEGDFNLATPAGTRFQLGMGLPGRTQGSGAVDEVSVYDRALSGGEIGGLFAAGAYGKKSAAPVTADAGGPYQVVEGGTVVLAGSGSANAGTVAAYEWDFDYDGATFTVDAAGAAPTFDAAGLDGPAVRTVALRVRDANGVYSAPSTATVTVGNANPTAALGAASGLEGTPLVFAFTAGADPSPADAAAGLHYSVAATRGGLAATYSAASGDPNATLSFAHAGLYAVYGRVFDKDGGFTDYTTTAAVGKAGTGTPAAAPGGLVGWWAGNGDAGDSAGNNTGTLVKRAGFAAGMVGQGFLFSAAAMPPSPPVVPPRGPLPLPPARRLRLPRRPGRRCKRRPRPCRRARPTARWNCGCGWTPFRRRRRSSPGTAGSASPGRRSTSASSATAGSSSPSGATPWSGRHRRGPLVSRRRGRRRRRGDALRGRGRRRLAGDGR